VIDLHPMECFSDDTTELAGHSEVAVVAALLSGRSSIALFLSSDALRQPRLLHFMLMG
jgi:hypothetical protein